MSTSSHVPPGFRFHPTDEELVDYYLRKKVASRRIDLDIIKDIDLYKIEPWDLQEKCRIGQDEQSEWYFFSHKDKKYPTGTRTNRATAVGFWKATGRDKPIYAKHNLVGMRKTLVFYKGRAPNGQKSDWIMHEYRLETSENGPPQEEGWVVCRVFKKRVPTTRKEIEQENPCWYDEEGPFIHDLNSPMRMVPQMHPMAFNQHLHPQKRELQLQYQLLNESFHQLPHLESPKLPNYINHGSNIQPTFISQDDIVQVQAGHRLQMIAVCNRNENADQSEDQVTDWRVLDKFVASQLSHDVSQEQDYTEPTDAFQVSEKQQEVVADYASASTSSSQIDHWN